MPSGRNAALTCRSDRRGRQGPCRQIHAEIIKSFGTGDPMAVLAVVAWHLPEMNLVNLTTALHRLAKLTETSSRSPALLRRRPVFEQLLHSVSVALDALKPGEISAQSLSSVAWALATLKLARVDLFSKVVASATSSMSSFQPFELSTLLWACAKLGAADDDIAHCIEPVFEGAETHIAAHISSFSFRCLANVLWAFATAKRYRSFAFRAIAEHMSPQIYAAHCQEMAKTTWALGRASFRDERLCSELASHALGHLEEFKPQELSNMIWGFGSIGFFHEDFFAGAAATLQNMKLTTQHLANILAAFVRAAPEHPVTKATIVNLLPRCCKQVGAFKPQEVSAVLLAIAKAFGSSGAAVPEMVYRFFEVAAPQMMPCLPSFSSQSLASLAKAFAWVPVSSAHDLVDAISEEAWKRHARGSQCADLHNYLHALGFTDGATPMAACKDTQPAARAEATSFAPSQKPKKENSRRCQGQTQGEGGGPNQAHDQASVPSSACKALSITASAGSLPQWYLAGGSWSQGVGAEWSPYWTSHEAVGTTIAAVEASAGIVERALSDSPCSELATCGQSRQSPSVEGNWRSPDLKWHCSVKNSFLHVDLGYDSDSVDDQGSWDGGSSQRSGVVSRGSSQRSSSVPSCLVDTNPAEEWHKRYMDKNEGMMHSQRFTNDLASLSFAWEMPGLLGCRARKDIVTIAS